MPPARPTSRADRLDLMARMLGDRPGITAHELAEDLGQSVRTIFRDLEALRARGFPIEASRGRGGGLRLAPRWGLGRVLLSRDEALGTLLGLAITSRVGFPLFGPEVERARRRIADTFPPAERKRLAPLRERIFVGAPASAAVSRSYADPVRDCMRHLQVAFADAHLIRAEYVAENGAVATRRLEAHALVINWPAWYVLAHDHLRDAPRTFRLDRFRRVEVEPDLFRPWPRARMRALFDELGVAMEGV